MTRHFTINCRGRLISIENPIIMGILNLTPDSFFEQSRVRNDASLLDKAAQMVDDGAHILDVGGMSSRPGAEEISIQEELDRILPALNALHKAFPDTPISVDTYRSDVARAVIAEGASMINDISAGELDSEMFKVIAEENVPYVAMHMKGNPKDMNARAKYDNVLEDVIGYLAKQLQQLRQLNVSDVIIDPGFGFAKTKKHNYELLSGLDIITKILDAPLLVGLSRKSMFYKDQGLQALDVLPATVAANTIALERGANILRVHDVAAARQSIEVFLETTQARTRMR